MLSSAVDRILDFTVAPGYGRLGYRLRSRGWGARVPDGALRGRDVLVTGASSGIGEAACRQLCEAGARVHMLVRSRERGESARERVQAAGPGEARIHVCDVSDLDSVREFATAFGAEVPALAGLVHNAGVLTSERERSQQGLELTFATAVAGPFLMTRMLLPALREGAPSRVVWVSSGGMFTAGLDPDDLQLDDRDFDGARFYAHAKRAQVILAEMFARREGNTGVAFASMHPGWAETPGLAASLPRFSKLMGPILRDADEGADTAVWLLASPEVDERSGGLWHDRRPRSPHRIPGTRESASDRERLWSELERLTDTDRAPVEAAD
jgi:NAD(P)-dependent dehydrogenase (short-subunit alcohol dehydrogenase family)